MTLKFFRWMGGKIRAVPKIIPLLPEKFDCYYEPFVGSAAVLLNKQRSDLEVINDKDINLSLLHKTMADREKGKRLVDILLKQQCSRNEFLQASQQLRYNARNLDDVERSRCTFVTISQSFNANRVSPKPSYDVRGYMNDLNCQLPQVYERYADVRVLQGCGIELMEKIKNNANAFAFLDPPYVMRYRGNKNIYFCEMPDYLQMKMLETIKFAKCKIMLCGYIEPNHEMDLYSRVLLPCGWQRYKLMELVKACQTSATKDKGEEYIWVNYQLPDCARYVIPLSTKLSFDCNRQMVVADRDPT
ncbi:MAG: DNA adenine methylase [Hungatella sp.]